MNQTGKQLSMRTLLITIASTVIAGTGIFSLTASGILSAPCSQPISYRIKSIDSRFGVTTSTVQGLLQDAETVWEENTEKDLFVHDPENGELAVNFIYDERQRRTEEQERFATDLSSLADTHSGLTDVLKSRQTTYENRLQKYEADRKQYEQDLADYNERVEELNKQRQPISSSTQQELQKKQKELETIREQLSQRQQELERLRKELNQLADRSNDLAQTYNQKASTFNDRFGTSRKFDQATYTGEDINVYQFRQASDLRLALAHEFGHALGIKHVEEPTAIMHYLMKQQQLNPIELTDADQAALNNICEQ